MRLDVGAVIVSLLVLPCAAKAQDFTLYGGVKATSNYLSSGYTQSDNHAALQAYLEGEYKGFYAGIWTSTVDFNTSDDAEIDLYVGYRGEFANGLSYDVAYYRYFYNSTGNCCGEIDFDLGAPITDQLSVTSEIFYDFSVDRFGSNVTVDYAMADKWALQGVYGFSPANADGYGELAVSYMPVDSVTLELRAVKPWHGDAKFALSAAFDTTLLSR